jgi:long-chain fatty acid transport protein
MSIRVAAALLAATAAVPAMAGGFYLQEQSPTGVGRAFAGEAAIADNAATIFFNPAGMTRLPGANLDLGGQLLFVNSHQRDTGSTRTYPGVPGAYPVGGNDGGNPFDRPVVVPAGYGSFQFAGSNLWVGLGISAPFGLKVQYDDGWFGRYDSVRSKLTTLNFQPSLAWKINDRVSIGGGFDIQRMSADLTSALPNLAPGLPDGALDITGGDLAFGWNAGVLADFGIVRVGAHYRSHINHRLSGVSTISGLLGPLAGSNGTTRGFAPISTPDIATVSAVVGGDGPVRLLGSATWTKWSRFQRITVENEAGVPYLESDQNYRDTWTFALGGEFDISRRLTLRAGTMHDETPTVDAYRTTRVPDGNRWWASAGATWRMNDAVAFNLGYAHIFVSTAEVHRADPLFAGTPAQLTVSTNSINTGSADELAASVSLRF